MCGARSWNWLIVAAALAIASVVRGPIARAQIPGQEANGGPKADRRYDSGPLTEADFRGKTPTEGELAGSPFQAFLFSDIIWSSKYGEYSSRIRR